jgi:hypothetical protein
MDRILTLASLKWVEGLPDTLLLTQTTFEDWDVNDVLFFIDELSLKVNRNTSRVYLIVLCAPENPPVPHYMSLVSHLRKSDFRNLHLVVCVQVNMFVRTFIDLAQRLHIPAADKVYFVDTLEDAYTLVRTHRSRPQGADNNG